MFSKKAYYLFLRSIYLYFNLNLPLELYISLGISSINPMHRYSLGRVTSHKGRPKRHPHNLKKTQIPTERQSRLRSQRLFFIFSALAFIFVCFLLFWEKRQPKLYEKKNIRNNNTTPA